MTEPSRPAGPAADLGALARAGEALLALVHADDRALVAISLGNLRDIHAAGRVEVSKILGLRQYLRKAMRQAWQDGVHAPLAMSRDPQARALLGGLPAMTALEDHAGLAAGVAEAVARVRPDNTDVVRHAARAQAYAGAIPVLLLALDDLDGLGRAFDPSAVPPRKDQRGRTASRRVRQAFVREAAPLLARVAAVAHKEPLGEACREPLPLASAVLSRAPASGVRLRDPAGAKWVSDLGEALASDIVASRVGPVLEGLFAGRPGLALAGISFEAPSGLSGVLEATVAYGEATLALTCRFDVATGTVEDASAGTVPGRAPETLAREGKPPSSTGSPPLRPWPVPSAGWGADGAPVKHSVTVWPHGRAATGSPARHPHGDGP